MRSSRNAAVELIRSHGPELEQLVALLPEHETVDGTPFKLIILSNVDRASFAGSSQRLAMTFDSVLTAQDIGSYKLSARNRAAPVSETPRASRLHDVHPHRETVALYEIPDPIHIVSHGSYSFDVFLWPEGGASRAADTRRAG